jgi:hypothetical protein
MLILFMDAAVGWVLNVRLSEQQTCAMLIMFIDVAGGWVLDVRLYEQETCAMLTYLLQRDCWLLGCYFQTRP